MPITFSGRPEAAAISVMLIQDGRVVVRNPDFEWWGTEVYGGPYLDTIEFLDYGTDPSAWVAAAEAEEVEATDIEASTEEEQDAEKQAFNV